MVTLNMIKKFKYIFELLKYKSFLWLCINKTDISLKEKISVMPVNIIDDPRNNTFSYDTYTYENCIKFICRMIAFSKFYYAESFTYERVNELWISIRESNIYAIDKKTKEFINTILINMQIDNSDKIFKNHRAKEIYDIVQKYEC